MSTTKTISLVIPVFNEEAVIELAFERLTAVLEKNHMTYELIFVDDGSHDRTFELLKRCQQKRPQQIRIIKFARNFGHQLAITAGLREAKADAVAVMDADLQDPPEVLLTFLQKWREGYQVVYGIRTRRAGESFFKKFTASLFYKLLRRLTNIDIPENVGDFYLLDRKVVDVLNAMEEKHRFLRGLIMWIGFKRVGIGYERQARLAGQTKFGLWRMIKFSLDAATSFSFAPLRGILILGLFLSFSSFLGILYILYLKFFTAKTVIGWTSIMIVVLLIGGVQLISIGLIGEYLARIGDDVKKRPLYTIEEIL